MMNLMKGWYKVIGLYLASLALPKNKGNLNRAVSLSIILG